MLALTWPSVHPTELCPPRVPHKTRFYSPRYSKHRNGRPALRKGRALGYRVSPVSPLLLSAMRQSMHGMDWRYKW